MTDFDPNDQFASDRVEKTQNIEDAYPHINRDMDISTYREEYDVGEDLNEEVSLDLAGRVTRVNDLNGIAFYDIEDQSGSVQVIFHEDETDEFENLDTIDTADILWVRGHPHVTNTGEFSILATEYQMAAKTLHHPPDSESRMSNREEVRNRTPALQNTELHESVRTRFEMTSVVRSFLEERGYLEVETPILHHVPGGASAQPFETESNALNQDMYLRIAPELYLKRMVTSGFERIFEVGRVFRNEDIDTTHNPEFTMLELYEAYADYEDMMDLTEELVSEVAHQITGSYTVTFDGSELDFTPPWPRMTVEESLEEYANLTVSELSDAEMRAMIEENEGDVPSPFSRGEALMELYDVLVEEEIVGPVFITDHPRESTPLCRTHPNDSSRLERFEAVVAGVELANAYTELNDPMEQAELFLEQDAENADMEYVDAIGNGLPPSGGLGIGIDRLAMLLTDSQSIKEIVAFPMYRSGD